jgi:hypothetical protein
MKITMFKFSILLQFMLILNLNAVLDDNYRNTAALYAASNGDKDTAIDIYRKIGRQATANTVAAELVKLFPEAAPLPVRWAELDNNDKIAEEAVAVYEKHSGLLANPLARAATDPSRY